MGIFARNSLEWVVCDYASVILGYAIVPMAVTFDQASVEHIINLTKMTTILVDKETFQKVRLESLNPFLSLLVFVFQSLRSS